MSDDFAAQTLLDAAKARYSESVLRARMSGAAGDEDAADVELLGIAESVIARVRSAAQVSVGWPLPGKDPETDVAYSEAWPKNLLQHALELFNFRTQATSDTLSIDQRKIGEAAESYFDELSAGAEAWGIAGNTDSGTPSPISARLRDGTSQVSDVRSRRNLFDELSGPGWDFVH